MSASPALRRVVMLPLLALLSLVVSPVSAQTYYSFCYYQQNTLATSPYLPWSTYAQGTLSVTAVGTLLTVVGITGTREVYVQGKAIQTNNILGLSPPLAYADNNNILNNTAPFISGRNALTFYLDGIAQFAQGPAVFKGYPLGTPNVSINAWTQYSYTGSAVINNAVTESDMPPNDGVTNVITSGFLLAPATTFANSFAGCTLPRPSAPTISSAVLTAYNALMTWPMCYQFAFGQEGLGRAGFITTVSGVITTRGYLGASPTGAATGYLATGINGTRNYTVQSNSLNVPSQSYIINMIGIGAPLAPYLNFAAYSSTSTLRRFVNNVLYPTFPQIDQWGLSILTNASVLDEYTGSVVNGTFDQNLIGSAQTNTTSFVLFTDSSYLIYDELWKLASPTATTVSRDQNWADTLNVQTQTQYNALVPSVYPTQAAWTAGVCGNDYTVVPTKYNFCWYVDNTNTSFNAVNRGVSYVYGTMTAKTGLMRYGQPAMQLQGMNGIRVLLNTNTSTSIASSLVQLLPPNSLFEDYLISEGYWWLTDNVLFTQAPWFSEAGLAVRFASFQNPSYSTSNTGMPSQAITNYMNMYSTWSYGNGPFGLTEYAMGDLNFPYTPFVPNISLSNFAYTPYVAGQLASCSTGDNKVTMATSSFSFCWFRQSTAGYINQFSAQLFVYSQPVIRNGRTGYVVQSFVGLRTYSDKNGIMQSDVIQGVDGDTLLFSSGATYATNFDNLIFDSAPFLSSGGLVYSVQGALGDFETFLSTTVVGSGLAETNVGRLWYDEGGATFGGSPPYNYYDESLFNVSSPNVGANGAVNGSDLWYYIDLTGPYNNVQVIKDGGASALAGTAVQTYCNQPTYELYAFSYVMTQTLTTSPFLPWSVFVTGYLNVSTTSGQYWTNGPGYKVQGIVGTRTIQVGGKTYTNKIVGLAPPKTWNSNDNLINLGAPYLNSVHVLTYVLDGPAYFGSGAIPSVFGANSTYVSLSNFTSGKYATTGAGIQEFDNGQNDGVLQSITSSFDIRLCPTFSDLVACGYVSPLTPPTISWNAAALTAYQTTSQISMCFSVTQGPGTYANVARGYYQTTISAILTVTGWGSAVGTVAGSAYNGPAYLITAAVGNRTYQFPDGSQQVLPVTLGGFNAAVKHFPNYLTTSPAGISSNNIYYPTFPQLDNYGIQFQASSDFDNNGEGDYHSNVDHVYWSGSDWREANTDYSLALYSTGVTFNNYGGNAVFAPTTNFADQTNGGGSCQLQYGAPLTYSFCYWINNTGAGTNGYVTYANGLVTAVGPQSRYGRQAIAVTGMTGVRVLAMNNGSSYPQNIIGIQYVDADTFSIGSQGYVWLTDNLIFPSGVPEVSLLGVSYITSNPVEMPAGAGGTDVIISTDGLTSGNNLYECVGSENFCIQSTSYLFKSQPYTTGGAMASCQSPVVPVVPAPPSLLYYDFCYAMNGPDRCGFTISASGTIAVFNTPVSVNGRVGYPMANITGTRTYTDGVGNTFQANIAGLSEDWQAVQNGWKYDQLFFPSSSPTVDSLGILYKYSGVINNFGSSNPFYYDRVVRLFSNATYPVVEEVWVTNGTSPYQTRYFQQNGVVKSAAQGTLSASSCSANIGPTGFTGVCTISSTGGGTTVIIQSSSSSSSLSGGQIAGIVVGTVIGAALFCAICFFIGVYGFAKKGGAEKSTTRYDTQNDVSKVGQSQVELQPAETTTEA